MKNAAKKILVVVSSPRPRGDSTILPGEAARGAAEAGAEVRKNKAVMKEAYELGRALAS